MSKDVGRHVESVRRRRRDLGVAPGRIERQRGKLRCIRSVNQVMSSARVLWLSSKQFCQNPDGLFLIECATVVRRQCKQRKGIEGSGVVIVGITLMQTQHRIGIRLNAGGSSQVLFWLIERLSSIEERQFSCIFPQ